MDLTQKLQSMRADLAELINVASLESFFDMADTELADYIIAALKDLGYGTTSYTDQYRPVTGAPIQSITLAREVEASQFSDAVRVDRIASGMAVPLSFRYVHTPTGITHTAYTIRAADRLEPGEEQRVRDAGMVAIYTKVLAAAGMPAPLDMSGFGGEKVAD